MTQKISHFQTLMFNSDMDKLKKKTGKVHAKDALQDAVAFLLGASDDELKAFVERNR